MITDEIDENLTLSVAQPANVEVIDGAAGEPGLAGALPDVLLTKGAVAKLEEMFK